MGCNKPGCGGGVRTNPNASGLSISQSNLVNMNDDEFVMVSYQHPNRGSHPVYGAAVANGKPNFYGYRSHGEKFLVTRRDQRAYPHYFHIVESVPEPPKIAVTPPPPPTLIENASKNPTTPPPAILDAVREARFDLQLLPGITPALQKAMAQAHLTSADAIIVGGEDALTAVKGIGKAKAAAILTYVTERYA